MTTIRDARLRACKLWPLGSHAILSLVPVECREINSMAVDRHWRLYWNPECVGQLTDEQAAAIILHEVFHLFLKHHRRAPVMVSADDPQAWRRWNIAADLAINDQLAEEGITVPGTDVFPERAGFDRGLSAERYYELLRKREEDNEQAENAAQQIEQQEEDSAGDDSGDGSGEGQTEGSGEADEIPENDADQGDSGPQEDVNDGEPQDGDSGDSPGEGDSGEDSAGEQHHVEPGNGSGGSCADGQQRPWELGSPDESGEEGIEDHEADMIVRAVAERVKARGTGSAGMRLWAEEILNPRIDPRSQLLILVRAAVDQVTGTGEYTYRRPSRRSVSPDMPLPVSMSPLSRITVIVDTSGSMDKREIGLALGLIGKVLKTLPNRDGVRVICGDEAVGTAANVFDPKQIVLAGGGGTDMGVLVEAAAAEKPRPELVIVATDGYTPWPAQQTPMPVVACLTQPEHEVYPVPSWVKKIHLN